MQRIVRQFPIVGALVAALWLVAAAPVATAPSLQRLKGVDELKSWFNAGTGHPRLVLLLSPT